MKKIIKNKIASILLSTAFTAGAFSNVCYADSDSEIKKITNESDSSQISIEGYQVGGESEYAVELLWSNMVFYYDKGKYNFTSGSFSPYYGNEDAENNYNTTLNSSADSQKVGLWHGFDGANNRIILINRSNKDLYAKYATTENTDNVGNNVDLQLLSGSVITSKDYTNVVKDPDNPESGKYYPECLVNDTDKDKNSIFGTGTTAENAQYTIPGEVFTNGSGIGKMSYQNIYINITGTPSDKFATASNIENLKNGDEYKYQNLTGGSNSAIGTATITLSANSSF